MAARHRPTGPAEPANTEPEDVAETVLAEPVSATSAPMAKESEQAAAPLPRRGPASGFVPALAGGVLAAALGFGLSHFNLLGLAPAPQDLTGLTARLATTEAGLTKMAGEIASLQSAPAPVDEALVDRLSALETAGASVLPDPRVDELISRMDALETDLANASASDTGVSGAALAALQAEIRGLKSAAPAASQDLTALASQIEARLAEAEAKAQALTAEAEAIAAQARTAAAFDQLRAALDTGQPYSASLSMLAASDVPAALSDHAETGLPTLASLQASFPEAARAGLSAALRANMGESWTERVGTFLRSQTGARSLTPREGNDPDAILSRAEAALATADLVSALKEIATLPPDAQAAMADWTVTAEQRLAAAAAIDALVAKSGG